MLNSVTADFKDKLNLYSWFTVAVRCLILFLSLSVPAPSGMAGEVNAQQSPIAREITAIISSKQHPYLQLPDFSNRFLDLDTLYKMGDYQLLWLGHPASEKNIAEALNLLANATNQGLNPVNYDTEMLKRNLSETLKLKPDSPQKMALYDTALSLSLLRYLHDLHYGRVNPQGINFKLKLREKKLADLPVLIKSSLRQGTVVQLPEIVEPRFFQYQKLKLALTRYRQLEYKFQPFYLELKKSLRPGERHPQIGRLRDFLIAYGDLEDDKKVDPKSSDLYSTKMSHGVKRFQKRHGLAADGIIGKGTAEALNVPLNQRITQIELAMERLRWLPDIHSGPHIIVNIPAFQLWAFDDIKKPNPEVLNMKVVVGKALKNQTPVLMAEMRFIDFMPYWNVPYSIVKAEILPKLIENPDYLEKENMELITGSGNDIKIVPYSADTLASIKQGSIRVRQRPGNKNALGRVKFMFPNKEDVYLHDTPANSLFSRSRRDFSHGCVRVENPEGLANFVLKDQTEWSKDKIKQALQTPINHRVILSRPIPVLFFYITSFIDENGGLTFYPDIYGHDAVLMEALKKPQDLSDQSLFISKNMASSPVVK